MLYKALISDLDETLITGRDGLPSDRVTQSIKEAQELIHIGLATSRPYIHTKHIFDHLQLTGPSIIHGGGRIIDAQSLKVLWQQPLLHEDVKIAAEAALSLNINFLINDDGENYEYTSYYRPKDPLHLWVFTTTPEKTDEYIHLLENIPTLGLHIMKSSFNPKDTEILVTHAKATKSFGIAILLDLLHMQSDDIIGIGDGENDVPLLLSSGLKVAMGNAVDNLKAVADYIAPSVHEDGVATVIEKFVI